MAPAPSHAAPAHAGAVEMLARIPAGIASVLLSLLALAAAVVDDVRGAALLLVAAAIVGLLVWALGRRSRYSTRGRIAVGFGVAFSMPPVLGLIAMLLAWLAA